MGVMQQFENVASILWNLRRNAPNEARLMGDLALLLGALAVYFALRYGWVYRRDRIFLAKASGPGVTSQDLPRGGALADALGRLYVGGKVVSHLSGDALLGLARSRLEAFAERRLAWLRFLAYVPLLVGLSGTMIGLAKLLPELDFRNGRTETISRPPSAPQAASADRRHLEGVFVGTLFGIIGSVLGAAASMGFSRVAERVNGQAEQFVHLFVLPGMPEQRVRIDVQGDMLRVLEQQAKSAAELFSAELRKVADRLTENAHKSAEAADAATQSFKEAAKAVKEAGNLEKAAKALNVGIKNLEDGTALMLKVGGVFDEVVNKQRTVQEHTAAQALHVVRAAQQLGGALAEWSKAVAGQASRQETIAVDLAASVTDLRTEVGGVRGSFDGLAKDVRARNELETGKLEAAQKEVQRFAEAISDSLKTSSDVAQELAAIRQVSEQLGADTVQKLTPLVESQLKALLDQITVSFEQLATILPQATVEAQAAGKSLLRDVQEAHRGVPEITDRLTGLTRELMAQTDALQHQTEAIKALLEHPVVSIPTPLGGGKGGNSGKRPSDGVVSELQREVARLRAELLKMQQRNPAQHNPQASVLHPTAPNQRRGLRRFWPFWPNRERQQKAPRT